MKLVEFYKQFNQIVSNHKSTTDTTKKLNALLKSIKGTDIEGKVNIDLSIVDELDKQSKIKDDELKGYKKIEQYDEDDSYGYDDSYDEDN